MQAAALLNGRPMGGKHRSAHRHDLWSLKYLPGFQWDQLTDEIGDALPSKKVCSAAWSALAELGGCPAAYQNAVRDQKLAHEISTAKRERDFYLSRVSRAKAITAQEDRKRKVALAAAVCTGSCLGQPLSGCRGWLHGHAGSSCRCMLSLLVVTGRHAASCQHDQQGSVGHVDVTWAMQRGEQEGTPADSAPQQQASTASLRSFQQKQAQADPVADRQAPVMSPHMLRLIAGSDA